MAKRPKLRSAAPAGDPAMAESWRLREAGDVSLACKRARQVLLDPQSTSTERAEAVDLLERAAPPKIAWWIFAAVSVLLLSMILLAALRG